MRHVMLFSSLCWKKLRQQLLMVLVMATQGTYLEVRRFFGDPIDFIADSPCYGRGGERSKYERVERGGGQQR